ncbi:MAG: phosphonate ABC transporter permease, partial [Lachnospiraceae bacterium]|nr:phosphonate ABC transporter permease [Lachnospiraceae bacterium]
MTKRKWTMSGSLKILLCIFWLFAIILPLIRMLSTMASVNVLAVMGTKKFVKALAQSLLVSLTATSISVCLAGVLSWSVARTNLRHKTILNTLLTVPMLIPSISHGMGLIIILGANGWLSRMLGLEAGIYGFR